MTEQWKQISTFGNDSVILARGDERKLVLGDGHEIKYTFKAEPPKTRFEWTIEDELNKLLLGC